MWLGQSNLQIVIRWQISGKMLIEKNEKEVESDFTFKIDINEQ